MSRSSFLSGIEGLHLLGSPGLEIVLLLCAGCARSCARYPGGPDLAPDAPLAPASPGTVPPARAGFLIFVRRPRQVLYNYSLCQHGSSTTVSATEKQFYNCRCATPTFMCLLLLLFATDQRSVDRRLWVRPGPVNEPNMATPFPHPKFHRNNPSDAKRDPCSSPLQAWTQWEARRRGSIHWARVRLMGLCAIALTNCTRRHRSPTKGVRW